MKIRVRTATKKEVGEHPYDGGTAYTGLHVTMEGTSRMVAAWINETIEAGQCAMSGEVFKQDCERVQAILERAAPTGGMVSFGNSYAPDSFIVEEI